MSKKASADDATAPKRARKRNKKPKDMPKRPLSAYNLFFADERERILSAQRQGIEQDDFILPTEEEAERQKQQGKKKAPVLFQALARCVGKRWSALNETEKKKYEAQAEEEMKKYRVKMEEYQQNIVMNTMAQSAKQKRKKDKTGGELSDDLSPSRTTKKQATAEVNVKTDPTQGSNSLSSQGIDGIRLGAAPPLTANAATGMTLQQPPGGGVAGIPGLPQMASMPHQLQPTGFLPTGLGGTGGTSMDPNTAALLSSQFQTTGLPSSTSGMLPHYQQFSPFLQQQPTQQQQQQQGIVSGATMAGIPQQAQQSNALLLEQVLLQRQQQQAQAAALMSGAVVGGGSPADLLALQLQQQQPQQQQMLQPGNQVLFNYLANQQPQQQQPFVMGGPGSLGASTAGVGGMDLSNASNVHDIVSQQQAQQRPAGVGWDSDPSAGLGGSSEVGGVDASQQQGLSLLQQQPSQTQQLQQLLMNQEQQAQPGLQSLFNQDDPTNHPSAGVEPQHLQNGPRM